VHAVVRGSGPVVVLEAGAGGTSDSWGLVVPLLEPHATVLSYDRPGLGFSTGGAELDRRPLAVADRLSVLLDALDLPGPYLLVGHSIGGLHVRAFAHRRPADVRGLVLADPSAEGMRAALGRVPRSQRAAGAVLGGLLSAAAVGAPVGAHRLLEPVTSVRRLARPYGLDAQALAICSRTVRAVAAQAAEHRQVQQSLDQAERLGPVDVPCTVLSGDRFAGGGSSAPARAAVNELHAALAAASPLGRHEVLKGCGHLVPLEAPSAVAAAVQHLLDVTSAAGG
jgi:pimeloyl-ACP methyl ester carboxylesterase